jgi:putative SOS response-associated peptidase YedK
MCGRATMSASPDELAELFHLTELPLVEPRYNIAPTEPMAVIRTPGRLELLRFGLIPPWATDPREGTRFINARAETVAKQPAFRDAFRHRRCLVVVSGFYEWQVRGKKKQPFFVHREDGKPFALAGLWATWRSRDGQVVDSCSVITRVPSAMLAGVHDRMPVVLAPSDYDRWIDPGTSDAASFLEGHAEQLVIHPVSMRVNKAGTEGPELIERDDHTLG